MIKSFLREFPDSDGTIDQIDNIRWKKTVRRMPRKLKKGGVKRFDRLFPGVNKSIECHLTGIETGCCIGKTIDVAHGIGSKQTDVPELSRDLVGNQNSRCWNDQETGQYGYQQ